MKLEAIDYKILPDEKYTYSYYKKIYEKDIIETAKKRIEQNKDKLIHDNLILKEEPYIYIRFLYELGLQDFEKNNLEDIAPFLDEQVKFADKPLHDVVFMMWQKIIAISEVGGTYDLLNAEIYEPIDTTSFGQYS